MAQIIKLPIKGSKLGFRRVRRGARALESPDQLNLFPQPSAQILGFSSPDLDRFEQALVHDERGDDRAAALYAQAIQEDVCVADSFCNLGIIESENGNVIKAFNCFTTALKHNAQHVEAHYNLANLYFEQNDYRLAQLHFELAVEFDSSFANGYYNLALVQAIIGDTGTAMRTLAKYKQLASEEDGRRAEELVENLKRSMEAAKRLGVG